MQLKLIFRRILFLLIIIFLIYIIIFRRRSLRVYLTETHINKLKNENFLLNNTKYYRIPRIIHQTWKTHNIPIYWNKTVQSVHQFNTQQFEYHLWTDNDIHKFISEKYPYFYQHTFLKYKFNIQRIDAFRYFILYHYGGIYIDMDNGCRQSWNSLLNILEILDLNIKHLAAFPRTDPIGISNGFMITTKEHPLFKILISRLSLFNHNYLIDYFAIMLSTGPSYLSLNEYYFDQLYYQSRIRIIDEIVYSSIYTWHTPGNSWHGKDAKIILYIYHRLRNFNIKNFYYFLLIISFMILFLCYYQCRKRSLNYIYYCFRKINLY
ncbi:unnamed protein product [Rotaria sp. Silwood1]|nr:unnamed protein product [Rotaria sp. Silwood1]